MKTPLIRLFCLLLTLPALSPEALAQSTAFTYQGSLTDGGAPAAGLHDFEFKLYYAASGGTQEGVSVTREDVSVAGGQFTVTLDFGNTSFGGGPRWLEIGVRPGAAAGAFTTLAPRQSVTSAPYAYKAARADVVDGGTIRNPGFFGTTGTNALQFYVNAQLGLEVPLTVTVFGVCVKGLMNTGVMLTLWMIGPVFTITETLCE